MWLVAAGRACGSSHTFGTVPERRWLPRAGCCQTGSLRGDRGDGSRNIFQSWKRRRVVLHPMSTTLRPRTTHVSNLPLCGLLCRVTVVFAIAVSFPLLRLTIPIVTCIGCTSSITRCASSRTSTAKIARWGQQCRFALRRYSSCRTRKRRYRRSWKLPRRSSAPSGQPQPHCAVRCEEAFGRLTTLLAKTCQRSYTCRRHLLHAGEGRRPFRVAVPRSRPSRALFAQQAAWSQSINASWLTRAVGRRCAPENIVTETLAPVRLWPDQQAHTTYTLDACIDVTEA